MPEAISRNNLVTPRGGGGYFTMGQDGDVRQFWVVFGLKVLGLGYTFTGKYFYWKISVIGVYFHLEFSGIGVYYYTQNSGHGC